MGARLNSMNPAKVKREIAALERDPPPEALRGPVEIRRRPSLALLCLLSSFLLLISFAPFNYSWLAFVALVPWGLAVVGARKGRWLGLWVFGGGAAFWATGVYWLTWMALPGYIAAVPYLSLYWLVAALIVRKAFQRGVPAWVSLPVAWVALEYARAYALGGFNWFGLEQTQYRWARLIQITDVTGRYGVSFFVAMVNGALIDVFAQPLFARKRGGGARRARKVFVGLGACAAAAGALLGYGSWRLAQQTTRPGPVVGLVQQAFPISLNARAHESRDVFNAHVTASAQLAKATVGCDVVVWPESMLGYGNMDPAWLGLDPKDPEYDADLQAAVAEYQQNLSVLQRTIRTIGCPLLAGGGMPPRRAAEGERLSCNSALLYDTRLSTRTNKEELVLRGRYDKMQLVPFGEYVPFRDGWPWLHRLLRWFVPPVMAQLEPGEEPGRFEVASRGGERFDLAVPICFEGTFPRVCRRLVMAGGEKRADVLVNISNDGWFVFGSGGRTHASTELDQHLAQYVFRAVETRVPVVRAVNTGISAWIDSNGRIVEVVSHAGRRKMVAGNLVARTLVDSRESAYSQYGDVFALVLSVAAAAMLIGVWRPRRGDGDQARKGKHGKT